MPTEVSSELYHFLSSVNLHYSICFVMSRFYSFDDAAYRHFFNHNESILSSVNSQSLIE